MNKLKIFKIAFVAVMVFVTAGTLSVDGQRRERSGTLWSGQTANRDYQRRSNRDWQRRSNRRERETYGYRNYGQYRRTQVGNRRHSRYNSYRPTRRSTWTIRSLTTRGVRRSY